MSFYEKYILESCLNTIFENISYPEEIVFSHLRMDDCECVHPDPPPSELVFDGVVEEHAEEGEHHVGYLLLLRVLGVDVGEGDEPFLESAENDSLFCIISF